MNLLYGGTARRIGSEEARTQNHTRIELLRAAGRRAPAWQRLIDPKGVQPGKGRASLAATLFAAGGFFRGSFAPMLLRRSSIGLGAGKGFASLAGELGNDEVIGSAKKRRELGGSESVARF